jgi:hypothetical protein
VPPNPNAAQNELPNIIVFGDHHSIDFTSMSVCGTNPINIILWREIADFSSSNNSRDRVLIDISRSLENNVISHSLISFVEGLINILPKTIGSIRKSGTLEDFDVLANTKTLVIPFANGDSYTEVEIENIHRLLVLRGGRLIFVMASEDTETFGVGWGPAQMNGMLNTLMGIKALGFATPETVHVDTSNAITAGKVHASPINQVEGEYCLGGGKALVLNHNDIIIAEYLTGQTAISSKLLNVDTTATAAG